MTQVALITGAAQGLGRALADAFRVITHGLLK